MLAPRDRATELVDEWFPGQSVRQARIEQLTAEFEHVMAQVGQIAYSRAYNDAIEENVAVKPKNHTPESVELLPV